MLRYRMARDAEHDAVSRLADADGAENATGADDDSRT